MYNLKKKLVTRNFREKETVQDAIPKSCTEDPTSLKQLNSKYIQTCKQRSFHPHTRVN